MGVSPATLILSPFVSLISGNEPSGQAINACAVVDKSAEYAWSTHFQVTICKDRTQSRASPAGSPFLIELSQLVH